MGDGRWEARQRASRVLPDLVDVPAVGSRHHHVVRYLADDVELLDRHLQDTKETA